MSLANQLRIGMSLSAVIAVLGPNYGVSGIFYTWRRPEGCYNLIIENDRLTSIHSTPD